MFTCGDYLITWIAIDNLLRAVQEENKLNNILTIEKALEWLNEGDVEESRQTAGTRLETVLVTSPITAESESLSSILKIKYACKSMTSIKKTAS